jgi:cytochrome c peroxidase
MKAFILGAMTLTACVTEQDQLSTAESETSTLKNNHPIVNPLGVSTTYSSAGFVDLDNEFFQEFGTNGRHCGHCHKPAEGWTVSAAGVRDAFNRTGGLDPIFRTVDGSNRPDADVSTEAARRNAYSMLLNRGTIRVGIGIPDGAEFKLVAVDDPYGHATAAELSLFRRPLPSANLTFISQVMWDGRVAGATIHGRLADQANGATEGHAEAENPLPLEVRESIVNFESSLFNGQLVAHDSGSLTAEGARGGAEALASQAFTNARFNMFDTWATSDNEARRAAFRGQELFNTRTRPGGGSCRGCHSAQNSGSAVGIIFFNVGTSDGARRAADQPLYTLERTVDGVGTGEIITTTDPGRALITGRWTDMNRFKVPSMRALGARAPYFHGGSANTLAEVVDHYESALGFNFTDAEEADLVAFMAAL